MTSLPGASSAGPAGDRAPARNWRRCCCPTPGRRRAVSIRPGSIHHADQNGSQYCSIRYQAGAEKERHLDLDVGQGNCFDNAMVETFFKTLKAELVWRTIFQSRIEAADRNRQMHRRLLQSRPPPFGARLHQPLFSSKAGSVNRKRSPQMPGKSISACVPSRTGVELPPQRLQRNP